jgi:hypothetical protein
MMMVLVLMLDKNLQIISLLVITYLGEFNPEVQPLRLLNGKAAHKMMASHLQQKESPCISRSRRRKDAKSTRLSKLVIAIKK